MNATNIEISLDGTTWQRAQLRSPTATPASPNVPLPEGYRWCAVHEEGKPIRWVVMVDAGGAC